jgi:hypothetical protein
MMSRAMGMDVPSFNDTGNGGSGTNGFYSDSFNFHPDYGTNLWLAVSSVANGVVSLSLSNTVFTQTGEVYEVMSKTSLSDAAWNIETEVWAVSNQNWIAFSLPMSSPMNLFFWARDWTGLTENGNTTPDWWFWTYFGTTALSDNTLDANGNSLLSDYTNNVAPAVFTFSGVQVANNYVSTTPTTVQLNVTGSPYYMAVLVDDPNFNDAVWTNYTSPNLPVSLWPQGWHDVWIGLRGHADGASTAIWQWKRLKLDYTPPSLVITGPTNGTVNVPVIQLMGYSPEALGSIRYDLSNAAGTVTNQQVLVLDQSYSTDTWEFTTNTFQAFDVPLTNGVNTITLHATDLAGNTSTLSTNFTLDYSGVTNPVIQLFWPQNGEQISGSNFTWRGWVDDPTATISASITDTNGNTAVVQGYTERNGNFWVENLPMPNGTNSLTLAVTNAAGYGSTTNIFVSTSPLTVTMTPVPDDQLWNLTVTATGSISDSNCSLWINGVKAGVTNGVWTAANVPMTKGGVAIFDITCYSPGETQPDGSHGN